MNTNQTTIQQRYVQARQYDVAMFHYYQTPRPNAQARFADITCEGCQLVIVDRGDSYKTCECA